MSPLWSDLALARVAIADATTRGLVDGVQHAPARQAKPANDRFAPVRRVLHRPQDSFAL